MPTKYELQAARIESVFQAHKVPARVWQATVTPRFVRFDVTTALGTKLSAVERLNGEMAFALGATAVQIYREGGVIRVEVPRDAPRLLRLVELLPRIKDTKQHTQTCTALLGQDGDGHPLMLHIPSADVAHVLIAGTTGSGKTELLRTMLASLAQRNRAGMVQLALIDPKADRDGRNGPLSAFADLPHTAALVDAHGAAAVLAGVIGWMERRQRGALPHVVVAIDELADLLMTGGQPIADALTRLTQRGREANIHVVAATQRPAAALISGMVKANFPVRLVGSVTSTDDARIAAGMAQSGAERLLGRGDFLLVAKGQAIRFQAAYADKADLTRLVDGVGRITRAGPAPLPSGEWGGVGSGVGFATPPAALVALTGDSQPHPTPPHPAQRRPLRERYTTAELLGIIAEYDGNLSAAAEAAFGYKDVTTLAIMREAAAAPQETDHV